MPTVEAPYASIVDLCLFARNKYGDGLSDIDLDPGYAPDFRVNGEWIEDTECIPIEREFVANLIASLSNRAKETFESKHAADGRFALPDKSIVRFSLAKTDNGSCATLRLHPKEIRKWEDVGLPTHVLQLVKARHGGLVLFSGPPGSSKTTVMHSLIDYMNRFGPRRKIVIVEDPTEFIHRKNKCKFRQREIGLTAYDFDSAIKTVLREQPDVFVIGEVRDRDALRALFAAANLGVLCFATVHAETSTQTIDSIIKRYDLNQRDEIITTLKDTLRAIITLRLVPTVKGGRVAAYECLYNTKAIRSNLDDDPVKLRGSLQSSKGENMNLLEGHLSDLVAQGVITKETAIDFAPDIAMLRGV